jgi:hypothetical protein
VKQGSLIGFIDVSWNDVAYLVRRGYLVSANARDRNRIEVAAQKLRRNLVDGRQTSAQSSTGSNTPLGREQVRSKHHAGSRIERNRVSKKQPYAVANGHLISLKINEIGYHTPLFTGIRWLMAVERLQTLHGLKECGPVSGNKTRPECRDPPRRSPHPDLLPRRFWPLIGSLE